MDKEKQEILNHSAAHVMMQALTRLYGAIPGVGPAIENGFYHDFEAEHQVTEKDLADVEAEMKKIVKENLPIERKLLPIDEAIKLLKKKKYKYTAELAEDLKKQGETEVSFYDQGEFGNMCRGPHLAITGELKVFKLLKIAGAYWRGDEKNKMLQRIYGAAFETKEELSDYLKNLEEAEKRDHRKLGKELGLFVFSDLVGPGLPLYTFKGAIIRREIINYTNELQQSIGYQEVHTPNMNKAELFKVSGHYEKFKGDMFRVVSNYTDEEYYLKPMNCPHHTQIFASEMRSYKDLPMRIADFANLYRDEKPGELSGLLRLRCFSQDDAHCFCREDQIKKEFLNILGIIKKSLETYQMSYYIRLSLWDPEHREKFLGEPEVWKKSQALLKEILVENNIEHNISIGEAAMYGPKMDLMSKDSLGREWQISTIQLDFIMPGRFGLSYIDADGKEKTPVMIHRAIIGSPERFMGILIEHYGGAFPTWLSPTQALVIPVSEKFNDYGQSVKEKLAGAGVRVEIDSCDESLGKRIRNAEKQKIPYILVVGEKEAGSGTVAVRKRGEGDKGSQAVEKFIKEIAEEIGNRK